MLLYLIRFLFKSEAVYVMEGMLSWCKSLWCKNKVKRRAITVHWAVFSSCKGQCSCMQEKKVQTKTGLFTSLRQKSQKSPLDHLHAPYKHPRTSASSVLTNSFPSCSALLTWWQLMKGYPGYSSLSRLNIKLKTIYAGVHVGWVLRIPTMNRSVDSLNLTRGTFDPSPLYFSWHLAGFLACLCGFGTAAVWMLLTSVRNAPGVHIQTVYLSSVSALQTSAAIHDNVLWMEKFTFGTSFWPTVIIWNRYGQTQTNTSSTVRP